MHTHTHIYIYRHKMYEYNLLRVACVYVISGLTNHLVFDNQLDDSSLEKTNFSPLSRH